MPKKKTVFVGMSGGVDSSVTAALLQKEGYNVVGIFMKNWSDDSLYCTTEEDARDMRLVCEHLGIPYYTFNFEDEYREKVLEYFFAEYRRGRTPNPDILCNSEIKFRLFAKKAKKLGADLIATGHYAQARRGKLYRAKDTKKDQTYFLYRIEPKVLDYTLFPLGNYSKPEIRKLAKKFKLPTADRPDSQGICFIGEVDISEFLERQLPRKAGPVKDIRTGKVLGRHKGAYYYTIGQRHGIGVSGAPEPLYVVKLDIKTNTLFVGPDEFLYANGAELEQMHWLVREPKTPLRLEAKIRHSPESFPGELKQVGRKYVFHFDAPARAVTPGQSLVLYKDDLVLGGGIIKTAKM